MKHIPSVVMAIRYDLCIPCHGDCLSTSVLLFISCHCDCLSTCVLLLLVAIVTVLVLVYYFLFVVKVLYRY